MSEYERNELSVAIELMLEQIRPSSMQYRVLEAIVNRQANGIPRMTYDLDVANREFSKSPLGIEIPSIWELIALDIAPSPNFWENVQYAQQNQAAVRNAIYNLRDQFETLAKPEDRISLYIFNKFGPQNKHINVVTLIHDYENAAEQSRSKSNKILRSHVSNQARRLRVGGKTDDVILRELAAVLDNARQSAHLPRGLADEMRKLERK